MSESNDQIDEVALNVLLAEGLDVPTAFEASRTAAGEQESAKLLPSLIWWCVVFFVVLFILWVIA